MRGSRILGLIAALFAATIALPVRAEDDPAALCDAAAQTAARDSGVPADILLAITRAETGRRNRGVLRPWPWAINDNGQGVWFATRDEAMQAAQDRLSAGDDNFDIGCFQINTRWHGQAFASLNDMFDPATNARYAATFLTELMRETGDWNRAIAAYHSRTAELAGPYLDRVTALRGLPALPADSVQTADAAPQHPNLFPLLQSGTPGSAGSLVPMQGGLAPLFADRG